MLEFSNYDYVHLKYSFGPSCRDSTPYDKLDELEKIPIRKWDHEFEDIFAKAEIKGNELEFKYINQEIVDNNHLKLEDLVGAFNKTLKEDKFTLRYQL